jgi:hypothetical protein
LRIVEKEVTVTSTEADLEETPMRMAAVSICTRRAHDRIGLAWPSARLIAPGPGRCKPHRAGIDTYRVSAGAFSLLGHDFNIPAVAALRFILGRMPRE